MSDWGTMRFFVVEYGCRREVGTNGSTLGKLSVLSHGYFYLVPLLGLKGFIDVIDKVLHLVDLLFYHISRMNTYKQTGTTLKTTLKPPT